MLSADATAALTPTPPPDAPDFEPEAAAVTQLGAEVETLGTALTGDPLILALGERWLILRARADAECRACKEVGDEHDKLMDRFDEEARVIEAQIKDVPASGIPGLEVKLALVDAEWPTQRDCLEALMLQSALADAHRLTAALTPGADTALLVLEAEAAAFRARALAMPDGSPAEDEAREAVWEQMFDRDRRITRMPATSLAGVAVKLRRILDPENGIEIGDSADHLPAIRNVLAVIEGALGTRAAPALAPERELMGRYLCFLCTEAQLVHAQLFPELRDRFFVPHDPHVLDFIVDGEGGRTNKPTSARAAAVLGGLGISLGPDRRSAWANSTALQGAAS